MIRWKIEWRKPVLAAGLLGVMAGFFVQGGSAAGQDKPRFVLGDTLYENRFSGPEDVADWVVESRKEGHPVITSHEGRMRLESDVHFLLWCPEEFPDKIAVSWEFQPKVDRGLAMFWIAATGANGKDLFDPSLAPRDGSYPQYRSGDINALHVAYFRRNHPREGGFHEINFQTVSLRKSTVLDTGPRVAESGDPIPAAQYAIRPYRMQVIKYGPHFRLTINDLVVIDWKDGAEEALVLEGGKIGFRQMAGLIAEYANLRVNRVSKVPED